MSYLEAKLIHRKNCRVKARFRNISFPSKYYNFSHAHLFNESLIKDLKKNARMLTQKIVTSLIKRPAYIKKIQIVHSTQMCIRHTNKK